MSLDVLRGIPVLGIPVLNLCAFAMPLVADSSPLAVGDPEPWNKLGRAEKR